MSAFLFVFIVILIFVFYNFHYKRKGLPPGNFVKFLEIFYEI